MEILILATLVLGFTLNIFVMRVFLKSLVKKMNVPLQEQQILDMPNTAPLPTMPATSAPQFFDKPSKNDVMTEDTNEVDLDENSPIVIPPGVKLEVEGGDTIAPPGFEPQTPPIKN